MKAKKQKKIVTEKQLVELLKKELDALDLSGESDGDTIDLEEIARILMPEYRIESFEVVAKYELTPID